MNNMLFTILLIPGILAGITFHEYAHALTADRLGDKTPRLQGRLTLNPLTHIDPIGFIALLVFKFGWAKPVQINSSAFKSYYKDDLKVSIAGPLANLAVAFVSAVILALFSKFAMNDSTLAEIIYNILFLSLLVNCNLFVLNLLPLPGFDGFNILRDLFPKLFYNFAESIYRYQFIIIIIFLMSPLSSILVGVPARFVRNIIINIVNLI
ncbi:site-2 protease family protein [Clostridium sp. SYSU_GA19001]|nr:site-2 protease family protein [Clostridium caldaquaticum]MCM8709793.1 site-2 protease family protein [Clostridium caldaquaticum]